MNIDEEWMQYALQLAKKSEERDEVPVGAIIVYKNKIIGEGWNQPISSNNPTAHAEIMALQDAGEKIGNYRLLDSTMYVTLEPCVMCAGAMVHARIAKLVYAVDDQKTGACGSVFNMIQAEELNHNTEIKKGVLEKECQALIKNFFKEKRLKKS
ncbi:MAG: tRNA adenosine(34) deaminase TadA [Legionellales bacterium]|jgi:tRNA(adenine34) deaminase|nr:tRNA adenosine(34) deaminase TadA [Legionellales bacterium]MBK31885.1 tRNA adenosine(34) deaminase TadA [Legionellales bacterium]HBH09926.1 tRNA adenosine(34) deaminase TadA [Gammaproteobacteria bacterium]|tara:strand:+ start:367 stop:828 length:462 start_codon:yes stop_codon:yes gene_type:complete